MFRFADFQRRHSLAGMLLEVGVPLKSVAVSSSLARACAQLEMDNFECDIFSSFAASVTGWAASFFANSSFVISHPRAVRQIV